MTLDVYVCGAEHNETTRALTIVEPEPGDRGEPQRDEAVLHQHAGREQDGTRGDQTD